MRSDFPICFSLVCLGSLALFCGTLASGQSISANVSENEGASVSASSGSAVSGNVNSAAMAPSSASSAGNSMRASAEQEQVPSTSETEFRRPAGPELKLTRMSESRMSAPRGPASAPYAASFTRSRAQSSSLSPIGSANAISQSSGTPAGPLRIGARVKIGVAGGEGGAAPLSGAIPDSTQGSGFPSPPDSGTISPLEWTPALNFEFADFSQHLFLNPTMNVGPTPGPRFASNNRMRARSRTGLRTRPPASLPRNPLETGIQTSSQLHTSLKPSLGTSIDQQVGLLPADQP